jgi:hydrogenase 3 maturation protease
MDKTPTSLPSWNEPLTRLLASLKKADRPTRLAILGIGQETRGDDFAGAYLARRLLPYAVGNPNLLVLDVGSAPENFTSGLRHFQPDLILMVDAAQMDLPPGSVCWLDWQSIEKGLPVTHTFSLSIIAGFFKRELGSQVALIGIQPAQNEFAEPLSAVVAQAVQQLSQDLTVLVKAEQSQ